MGHGEHDGHFAKNSAGLGGGGHADVVFQNFDGAFDEKEELLGGFVLVDDELPGVKAPDLAALQRFKYGSHPWLYSNAGETRITPIFCEFLTTDGWVGKFLITKS
jgi:hypothetical protein